MFHHALRVAFLLILCLPAVVGAALESVIDEIMASVNGNGDVQYVEVRIREAGQQALGSRFAFFQCPADANSNPSVIISDTLSHEVTNTAVGSRWIIATAEVRSQCADES